MNHSIRASVREIRYAFRMCQRAMNFDEIHDVKIERLTNSNDSPANKEV